MLEQIYPLNLVERNPWYALLLGLSYAVIGIGIAALLFPEDPALVAVALIALMFYPTMSNLMKEGEQLESEKKEFNLFIFLKDHRALFSIYLLFFVGVFIIFAYFSLILPSLTANHLFNNQITALTGQATFDQGLFWYFIQHNGGVLAVVFLTSFFLGESGLLLITWNASVWGTFFGTLAKNAALNTNSSPFVTFLIVLAIVSPHTILEAFAYIASAATGGTISKAIIKEKLKSNRFYYVLFNTVVSFVFAVIILFLAALVETVVLSNVGLYQEIIEQSFM